MDKIIFGYGSLLGVKGWNATLNRKITKDDLIYLNLEGYKKLWSPTNKIYFPEEGKKEYYGAFLDIIKSENSTLKGVGVKLTDDEFEMIKKREGGYDMVDITESISEKIDGFKIYAAIIRDKQKYLNKDVEIVITKRYHDFVEEILEESENTELRENNIQNTIVSDFEIKDGVYNFIDEEINYYTGHTNGKSTI